MTRQQKIIVVSGILLLVGVFGIFILFFGTKKQAPQEETPTETIEEGNIDEFSGETPVVPQKITENPISVFTYRNNTLYYIDTAGALWANASRNLGEASSTNSEQAQRIGEFTIQEPNALFNSPDGVWVLVGEGAVGTQKKFSLIDMRDKTVVPLPQGVREARILSNTELVYYKESLAETGIFIYDISKKKERLIRSLNPIDARIRLINPNLLLISEKPTNGITNIALTLNLQTRELKNYFSNFLGASLAVIGENKILALTQNPTDEEGNSLYNLLILDEKGTITQTLDIVTIPEKCTINNRGTYLYCAVPTEWSKNMPGLDLPDDYYKQGTDFTEKIYRLDLITFTAEEITTESRIQDAIHLSVNEDNSKLYFHNRKDANIYSLALPQAE